MELLAVRTARIICYLNAEELNPNGRPIAHDYMNAFVERYSFIKRPTTADEILDTSNKGITFEMGKFGDVGINKVILFDWGVVVETSTSTDACEEILQDILKWGAERFGLSNRPSLISQTNYLSELVFSSDMVLPTISPKLQFLGKEITDLVASYLGNSLPFEAIGITVSFDGTQTKQLNTPFQIQRLTDSPFSLKKYYSGAPLRTFDHVRLLNQFEKVIQES
jgi:hypothetical protein